MVTSIRPAAYLLPTAETMDGRGARCSHILCAHHSFMHSSEEACYKTIRQGSAKSVLSVQEPHRCTSASQTRLAHLQRFS